MRVFEPDLLRNFLPGFPNLLKFQASTALGNSHIQFLAKTCPRIQVLKLNYKEKGEFGYENVGENDVDDVCISDIARACPDLQSVLLRRRSRIGSFGVASLIGFARNLRNLDLAGCYRVFDEGLKSIGGLNLEGLNLQGCCMITDVALAFLAEVPLCNTLKKLNIAQRDQITDEGLIYFKEMSRLEKLNLGDLGLVTGSGVEALAMGGTLKKLNLSWLFNIYDETLVAIARNCWNLEVLDMEGCEYVSGTGICAFSEHNSLKELILPYCYSSITGDELERLVLGCSTLEYIALDERLRTSIPMSVQENISRQNCVLDWM